MLVGMSLGLVAAATTGIIPGYTGANMNPSRAMALSVAGSNWKGKCFLSRPTETIIKKGTFADKHG